MRQDKKKRQKKKEGKKEKCSKFECGLGIVFPKKWNFFLSYFLSNLGR